MSKTIQLHCPSTKRTVDGFVISPFQSHDQILQGVRLALQIPYAGLHAVDAKPITKLDLLHEDQRVLVAAAKDELMLPDSPAEYEFYDGQEGEDVDLDLGEWEDLSEEEKCAHVQRLNEVKPETRNKLRFTRRWEDVQHDLVTQRLPGSKEAEDLIMQRWATSLDHFLPSACKPAKLKPSPTANEFWDPHAVGAIAVLASTTPGQSRLAAEFLDEAVQLRRADRDDGGLKIVQYTDVVNAVTILYEKAGVVPARLTKKGGGKAREKERKKMFREKRKKGKGGAE
jgi:hypothetical protein